MAERLSGFCEAILNINGICTSDLKCCVAKQIFKGEYPPELVIPSKQKITPVEAQPLRRPTTAAPTRRPPPITTQSTPRTEANTPLPEGACPGTCVTGFFALLCDEIDRRAQCPGNGRCCITKKVDERPGSSGRPPRPSPSQPQKTSFSSSSSSSSTPKCPGFCLPQMMSSVIYSTSSAERAYFRVYRDKDLFVFSALYQTLQHFA